MDPFISTPKESRGKGAQMLTDRRNLFWDNMSKFGEHVEFWGTFRLLGGATFGGRNKNDRVFSSTNGLKIMLIDDAEQQLPLPQ